MNGIDRALAIQLLLAQLAEDRARLRAGALALQTPVRWLDRVRPLALAIAPPLMRLRP